MVKVPKIRVRREGKAESSNGQPLGSASPFPTNGKIVSKKGTVKRHNVLSWKTRDQDDFTLRREWHQGPPSRCYWIIYKGFPRTGTPGERIGSLVLTPTFRLADFVANLQNKGHTITSADKRWIKC